MSFISRQQVRFAHVDAAGIVFYPRYFEMLNAAIEDYFAEYVGVDFRALHIVRGLGVPTVKIEAEFAAPSRLGDRLDFGVMAVETGRSSARFEVEVRCGDQLRWQGRLILVCIDLRTGEPVAWPEDARPPANDKAA